MSSEPLILDLMGLTCPIPVQRLRQTLRNMPKGGIIHLIGDDPESLHDIPALLKRLELPEAEIVEINGGWRHIIAVPPQ